MLDQLTIRGRLVTAAMKLAAERPWREVTLANIADSAGVSLVDVRNEFDSKGDVLAAFVRNVDEAVLARAPQRSGAQPARDALFEVIMSRFDVLSPYKPALKSIAAVWPPDAPVVRALCQSQAWMLRAAGIRSEGLEGQLRAAGLGTVYASVYRTWLSDDDPGLARTMAALDRRLRRGERTLQSIDDAVAKVCGFANKCADVARKRTRPEAGADPNAAADPAATVPPGALS
ncbi:MAG TPA: TetR family transcriptional regulator [Hyphomicrobium sp.]|jgi:AcrR family transcriptional regulator